MEKVRPWCGQPPDRGWLKNRTEQNSVQSLTISAINHSGRASELGGYINSVDRRRPSLSCSVRRNLFRAKLIIRYDDRYGVAKFSKYSVCSKVLELSTLMLKIPEFPYNTV